MMVERVLELAQQLRATVALAKGLSLFPTPTLHGSLTTACDSSSEDLTPPRASAHIYVIKNRDVRMSKCFLWLCLASRTVALVLISSWLLVRKPGPLISSVCSATCLATWGTQTTLLLGVKSIPRNLPSCGCPHDTSYYPGEEWGALDLLKS